MATDPRKGEKEGEDTHTDPRENKHKSPADASDLEHQGMARRGLTRPMAQMKMKSHNDKENTHKGGSHQHGMNRAQRVEMLESHHKETLWIYWTILILGIWLLIAPFTFGYLNEALWVKPSGGRGVWFSSQTHDGLRAWLMTASDLISGVLLLIFGWRSLQANRPKSLWACCFVGIWLNFAPVLFWAPTAAMYLNDTILGVLLIALTILIAGMPNMVMYMQMGPSVPRGWSYNPSSWPQRWIMIVTAFLGWVVSRYLAMFQLGYINYVWDPFFGFAEGTKQVLNSTMSHKWPISDGALGALTYTFEFLMGWMGGPARWRTMPWMVALFGILVIPLGLTHIILVISQPVIVGYWCTMCLLAAAIMLPMIPLELDEVVAMGQHMVEAKRRGDHGGSAWKIFWLGGSSKDSQPDKRSPALVELAQQPAKVLKASLWGMSLPWTLGVSTVLGIWLMFSPTLFGVSTPAAHVDHLVGALIITVSVICMGEVLRLGRYLNMLLGLVVALGPWFLSGSTTASLINNMIVGATIIALALPQGPKRETYGLWDKYIK